MIEEKSPTLKETHLDKSPIAITGFDAITDCRLPKGRKTLICGSAGSGKILMAMEFLVKGTNSIFIGYKLLTTPNNGTSKDHRIIAALGLKTRVPDNNCDEGCRCEKLRA